MIDKSFFRGTGCGLQDLLKRLGCCLAFYLKTKGLYKVPKLRDLGLFRAFVNTEDSRDSFAGKKPCYGPISSQHKVLDKTMCKVSLGAYNVLDATLHIQNYLRLGQVEINRAVLGASLCQQLCELLHNQKVFVYI